MLTRARRVLLACVLAMAAPTTLATRVAFAQPAPEAKATPATPLRIERVALFKNGLGYFTSTAKLPDKATTVVFGQLPLASHGTFWVGYEPGTPVKGLFIRPEVLTREAPISNIAELLATNVGRNVNLDLTSGSSGPLSVAGKLIRVSDPSAGTTDSPFYEWTPYRNNAVFERGSSAQVAIIQSKDGITAVNSNDIRRCTVVGADAVMTRTVNSEIPSLRMELTQPAGGKHVTVSYLAKGITWVPSYLIDLSDPKLARFTAKAEIINEVADLENVNVELVTGYPNLSFRDVMSPISMGQGLSQFMQALGQDSLDYHGGRGFTTRYQAVVTHNDTWYDNAGPGMRGTSADGSSSAAIGRSAEDLFLYPVNALTLKRSETALLQLFTAEMPYEHIYAWYIPEKSDAAPEQGSNSSGKSPSEEIWHSCRLVNTAKVPLTTAPAQFLQTGQIVGQDVCYYTNPGGTSLIRINRAMKVFAEKKELETEVCTLRKGLTSA